jgi:hypothetical protein
VSDTCHYFLIWQIELQHSPILLDAHVNAVHDTHHTPQTEQDDEGREDVLQEYLHDECREDDNKVHHVDDAPPEHGAQSEHEQQQFEQEEAHDPETRVVEH